MPVNTSATENGWLRKRWILRARKTVSLSSGLKFVHAQNRDDVLQILVALQHLLHAARHVVVFLADDLRRERAGGRGQRIDGGIDAQFRDGTLEHDGRIQVRERGGRRRVGQVVRRHVHGLEAR